MSTCPVPSTAVSGLLEHYVKKILAAPDIDIDLFRAQMASVGKMRHPITVLVASDDPALKISSRLAARRMRLGLADADLFRCRNRLRRPRERSEVNGNGT